LQTANKKICLVRNIPGSRGAGRLRNPLRNHLPVANPKALSYNASVVKIYSATNSLACFYNKDYFSLT
jgi:hypothetical protein